MSNNAEFLQILDNLLKDEPLLAFAKKRGLQDAYIPCGAGKIPASQYAVLLLFGLYAVNDTADRSATQPAFGRLALLTAMEAAKKDGWSFGSKLLYDLKAEGITIPRSEVLAFLAQDTAYPHLLVDTVPEDDENAAYTGNLPVDLFCANVLTQFGSISGRYKAEAAINTERCLKIVAGLSLDDPESVLSTLIEQYYGGNKKWGVFARFLKKNGFYTGPAAVTDSVNHLYACPGGLSRWVLNTFLWLLILAQPKNDEEVKKLLFAAVGQGLCHIGRYKKLSYMAEQLVNDGDSDALRVESVPAESYIYDDTIPIGDGRKSLYMLAGFFDKDLPEDVAAAIDCYEVDPQANPQHRAKLVQSPLCLLLYVAGVQAYRHFSLPWIFRAGK